MKIYCKTQVHLLYRLCVEMALFFLVLCRIIPFKPKPLLMFTWVCPECTKSELKSEG